jgi:hypothetical protein
LGAHHRQHTRFVAVYRPLRPVSTDLPSVRHRTLGTTARVSVGAHGRFVAFFSFATNLVPGDPNGVSDVFVRDRKLGTTERVSVGAHGRESDADSGLEGLAISADGRYVAFQSGATALVPGATDGVSNVFVRDRRRGRGSARDQDLCLGGLTR